MTLQSLECVEYLSFTEINGFKAARMISAVLLVRLQKSDRSFLRRSLDFRQSVEFDQLT
jgi:hypothetical protein